MNDVKKAEELKENYEKLKELSDSILSEK